MILTYFVKFVRWLLITVLTLVNINPFAPAFTAPTPLYRADESCLASFAVLSDTHIKDNFIRQGMLELGLSDLAEAEDKLDTVVFNGDITDHGYLDMWDCFAESMQKYDIAKDTMLVVGNHDTWGPDRDNFEDSVIPTFIRYNKEISGRDIDGMYYAATIGGFPAIVLGSEWDNTSATISQTQIDWFAEQMDKAAETGLPIFVFLHQPINQSHGLPYTWEMKKDDPPEKGGIGDASDAIEAILKSHKNVFFISGHLHNGMAREDTLTATYSSVERYENYTSINVPSFMYPDFTRGGYLSNGTGFVFEIYSDHVLIRARNFATSRWLPKYDVTIPLK